MRVRNLCLLFVLLLLDGLICEPTTTPTPAPTTTPAPTPLPTPTPRPPVTLRWNLDWVPESLDPVRANSDAEVDVARQLFVGLTAYDPQTGEPIPDLATHWDVGEGGQVYTFHLRADVQWVRYSADAARVEALRPVTAHDVVYSLRRAVNPETESYTAYVLYLIQNAEAINTMPITGTYDTKTLGVTALDDHTVRFALEQPAAYLPAILALPVAWPVPREAIEEYLKWWTEPEYIITNGPYVLAEPFGVPTWEDKEHLALVKNPSYYDAKNIQIERVEYIVAGDEDDALALYEKGGLDTLYLSSWFSPTDHVSPTLMSQLHIAAYPCTRYFSFNTYMPPFDNVHVRRAFSYAIDRQELFETVARNSHRPASVLSPPGVYGNVVDDPGAGIAFDPEKARQELALAGYPQGQDLPRITMHYGVCSIGKGNVAQAVAQMWEEYLHVKVEIQCWDSFHRHPLFPRPLPSCAEYLTSQPHMELTGWCPDYLDPYDFINEQSMMRLTQEIKRVRPDCELFLAGKELEIPGLEELLIAAGKEPDSARRKALYRKVERLLCVEACVVVPILHTNQVWLTRPYLHRDYPALGGQNFKDWRIDPH